MWSIATEQRLLDFLEQNEEIRNLVRQIEEEETNKFIDSLFTTGSIVTSAIISPQYGY